MAVAERHDYYNKVLVTATVIKKEIKQYAKCISLCKTKEKAK